MNTLLNRLSIKAKLAILRTNKDFILYNDNNNNIVSYKLSDDLHRYLNKEYKMYKVTSILKKEIRKDLLLMQFLDNYI